MAHTRKDSPLDALHTYFRLRYLEQIGVQIGTKEAAAGTFATFGHIPFYYKEKLHAVPLERNTESVIPFRALKKDLYSDEYFEYGTECYLAELVDMALEFDSIEAVRGTASTESQIVLGGICFGSHVRALMQDMLLTNGRHHEEIAVVIEQLLFMKGYTVLGGRPTILERIAQSDFPASANLATIPTAHELDDNFMPVDERPALTCYFEWFQRHARPVSREKLAQKGIPFKPALFQRATG